MIDPFASAWRAFSLAESTADGRHDTLDWRSREGPFAACIVRVPQDVLRPNLAALRENLEHIAGLRLHPDHFLHIMLQELGFVTAQPIRPDEISPARLEEFVQAAVSVAEVMSPAAISLGGANSFEDAVFLEVHPTKPLRTLHERLFDLAAIPHVADFAYLPHCTLGHYDGSVSVSEALEILAPWRHAICGEFALTEIEIVTLDTSNPYPELSSYAVIRLEP